MEENNSSNGSKEYTPENTTKRFFRIWKPVLLHQIVLLAASLVTTFFVSMTYFSKNQEVLRKAVNDRGLLMQLSEKLAEIASQYMVLTTALASVVLIIICYRMYHKDQNLRKEKTKSKNGVLQYLLLVGLSICLHYVLNNIIFASNLGAMSQSYQEMQKIFYSPSITMQLLVFGIIAPICEELIYRGLVYNRLREKNSFLKASLLASLIFGAVHGNGVQMLYGFVMGLLFSFLLEKFGTLVAPIFAHVLMNVMSITLTEVGIYNVLIKNEVLLMVTSVLVAGLGAMFFLQISKKPQESNLEILQK